MARGGLRHEPREHLPTHAADILLVLQEDAERAVQRLETEIRGAERTERRRPIERFRDAGLLEEIAAPKRLHDGDDAACEALRNGGQAARRDAPRAPPSRGVAPAEGEAAPGGGHALPGTSPA